MKKGICGSTLLTALSASTELSRMSLSKGGLLNILLPVLVLVLGISNLTEAYEGDLNWDSVINWADLDAFAEQWLNDSCSKKDWCNGADIDHSSRVELGDFALLGRYWDINFNERIEDLLAQMTLQEKVAQLGGDASGMSTPDNTRLGIPGFKMADGPQGVRWDQSTCFPSSLALGASWDPDLVQRVGEAMGKEFRGKGRYVALAPCINIIRDPRGGRSFETFGEDPYLVGQLAAAFVRGVQSQKVIAVAKHFACNNQENGRGTNNVLVNERTLREIYMPGFLACVQQAHVWAIMAAYNKVNGPYCTANQHLLTEILRDDWGFRGFVVSDWGATHATVECANAGLDVEMPTADYYGQPLLDAVGSGQVSEDTINEAVRRILRSKFWSGVFEQPVEPNESVINCPEHQALVLEAAKKSIVLLKNDTSLLPLDMGTLTKIAVIGPNAKVARPSGGGSAHITPYYAVSPWEGIINKVGGTVEVQFAQGCYFEEALYPIPSSVLKPPGGQLGQGLQGEYFNNRNLQSPSVLTRIDPNVDFDWSSGSPAPAVNADNFSVRWTGKLVPKKTGQYSLGTTTDDGVRLYLNNQPLINDWQDHAVKTNSVTVDLEADHEYDIRMEYYENGGLAVAKLVWIEPNYIEDLILEARQAADSADVAIVVVGTTSSIETEGIDRDHLDLPEGQDELIQAVSQENPNTVVAVVSGSAVLMHRWIADVPAVLECWFNGQEVGNAIADVLFGDQNPGGKLPVTFPNDESQLPPFDNNYEAPGEGPGYRHYEKYLKEPLFCFGHGLSYTDFEYSNLSISPQKVWSAAEVTISVDVNNVGQRAGDEVVQLYIRDVNASVERPNKELKAFKRISLEPQQEETVIFTLPVKELGFYDVNCNEFVVEGGGFEVLVGSSSCDIRLNGNFEVVSVAWNQVPAAAGPNSISMSAIISDPNSYSTAQYYFECTAGGGHDSGWQESPTYEDIGLQSEIEYTYRVKARDRSAPQNETEWSVEKSSSTEDNKPPTPNPMTWAILPHSAGATAISMTATTASDINGEQYFFECTAGNGHDSGWQDSPTYTDTGLSPNTQYTYWVKARDKSPGQNETGWSSEKSAMTDPVPTAFLVAHYEFEGDFNDSSSNGLHGNPNGGAALIYNAVRDSNVLSLDGVDDYVNCFNNSAFNITDAITLAAWVKTNDTANGEFNPYITKGDHTYGLKSNERNAMEFVIYDGTWITAETSVDASFNGVWHHVAGTYDGSELRLYIDGELAATTAHSGTINSTTHNVYLAGNSEASGRFYDGLIDDVRVYRVALSAADVNAVYQGNL
jgi:beta-glucosidase